MLPIGYTNRVYQSILVNIGFVLTWTGIPGPSLRLDRLAAGTCSLKAKHILGKDQFLTNTFIISSSLLYKLILEKARPKHKDIHKGDWICYSALI